MNRILLTINIRRISIMTKRKVEIFSAGCPICENTIELVNSLACPSCEIVIHDMHDESVQQQAKKLGVNSIPAVAINGNLGLNINYETSIPARYSIACLHVGITTGSGRVYRLYV